MNDVKFEPHVFSHYTSLDVLKSIVETKTLRMTDYRFLNDPKELKLGFSIYKEACNKSPKINKYKKFLKKFMNTKVEYRHQIYLLGQIKMEA